MKRIWGLCLGIAFTLVCLSAQAAGGMLLEAAENYSEQAMELCGDGENVYILKGDSILRYQEGMEAAEVYIHGVTGARGRYEMEDPDEAHVIDAMVCRQGTLLCLNQGKGAIFTVSPGADGAPCYGETIPLPFEKEMFTEDGQLGFQFQYMFAQQNGLLFGGYDWISDDGGDKAYLFDMETRALVSLARMEALHLLTPYREGRLLAIAGKNEDFYDPRTGEACDWPLSVYDLQTGTLTELCRVPSAIGYSTVREMLCDAQGTIYFAVPGRIYRIADGKTVELAAYQPIESLYSARMALAGKQIALLDGTNGGVYLRTPDPALLPEITLTIGGSGVSTSAHAKAAAAMEEIPVFFSDAYLESAQQVGQLLSSGEEQIDLLGLSSGMIDMERMIGKGYCLDLSGSETLTRYAERLYPFLRDYVTQDGRLYAIPVRLNNSILRANVPAMEALGYTAPETYAELAAMMNDFARDGNDAAWEKYTLFGEEGSAKQTLLLHLLGQYEAYARSRSEALSLRDPALLAALNAVDSLRTENVEISPENAWLADGSESEELMALWEKERLLLPYEAFDLYEERCQAEPLLLRLDEAGGRILPVEVEVLAVNPRSKHPEAAIMYLENLVQSFNGEFLASCTVDAGPVENPSYRMILSGYDEDLQRIARQLEQAAEIDRPELQQTYDSLAEARRYAVENERYSVTQEGIERYREMTPAMRASYPSILSAGSEGESFYSLCGRYLDGQIGLEQFISEGEGKLRLMQMENP